MIPSPDRGPALDPCKTTKLGSILQFWVTSPGQSHAMCQELPESMGGVFHRHIQAVLAQNFRCLPSVAHLLVFQLFERLVTLSGPALSAPAVTFLSCVSQGVLNTQSSCCLLCFGARVTKTCPEQHSLVSLCLAAFSALLVTFVFSWDISHLNYFSKLSLKSVEQSRHS